GADGGEATRIERTAHRLQSELLRPREQCRRRLERTVLGGEPRIGVGRGALLAFDVCFGRTQHGDAGGIDRGIGGALHPFARGHLSLRAIDGADAALHDVDGALAAMEIADSHWTFPYRPTRPSRLTSVSSTSSIA